MRISLAYPLTLDEITEFCGGTKAYFQNQAVCSITTDSRIALEGDLFIAIKNGDEEKNYLSEAKSKGALILSNDKTFSDIVVDDAEKSLLSIASNYKSKFKKLIATVAITGSVGKTTTKEILGVLASTTYRTHKTSGNQNNRIGMSYTILSAPKDTELLILEMGMNHLGEIRELSVAARPDVAIITNIGHAHIGNLGSRENIAKAKLEITCGMTKDRLIVPFDEPLLEVPKVFFRFSEHNKNADVYCNDVDYKENETVLSIKAPGCYIKNVVLAVPGNHITHALLACISAARLLNISEEDLYDGISKINRNLFRQKYVRIGQFEIYDDSYNSSPEAVISALEMISMKAGAKSCVLGDMLELGKESERMHYLIGYNAAVKGFDRIYAFGNYSKQIQHGAVSGGLSEECVFINENISAPEITAIQIKQNSTPNEIILFKASHLVQIDRIYKKLANVLENNNA